MEAKQRSNEWHDQRLGMFTASQAHKLMGVKGFGQTGETYIFDKVAETLTGEWPQQFENAAMKWGNELEAYAVAHYESAFGIKTKSASFITCKDLPGCGASPDRLMPEISTGIEIKCPYNSSNHIKYMTIKNASDLKSVAKEYYWQICQQLLITGYKAWEFVSYDPRMINDRYKMYVVPIVPLSGDIDLLKDRLSQAVEMKESIINQIKSL